MKASNTTRLILAILMVGVVSLPGLSEGSEAVPSTDPCAQAKKAFMDGEREWSSLNREVGFMHRDLERLRDLRWDTKVALSVLDEAIYILHEKGSLSSKDLAGLNARIADRSCRVNPDGTFTCNTRKAVALKEAREALYNVLARSEEDIERTEKETREKEQQCHQMNQRLAGLEDWVEKECRATNSPTPWEQGVIRMPDPDIYNRYVERERRRQIEVENRTWLDIERAWLKRYYHDPYPYVIPILQPPFPPPHHPPPR